MCSNNDRHATYGFFVAPCIGYSLLKLILLHIFKTWGARWEMTAKGGMSKVQQIILQAKTVFLTTSRNQSISDPGFAADLDKLKYLVIVWVYS